jgi:hypothetical protein
MVSVSARLTLVVLLALAWIVYAVTFGRER